MPINISIKTCYSLKISLVLLLSGFAVSCTAVPIKKAEIKISQDIGAIKALDTTQALIHMRPEDLKRVKKEIAALVSRDKNVRFSGNWIISAAVKTFSKIFKNVKSSEFSQSSNLVITISGGQLRSLGWGVLESDITATVSLATGKKIGEYYATGRYGGPFYKINDSKGLEALYVKAFVQILEAMLKDERLAKYFENGFGEIQTANLPGKQPTPQSSKVAKVPETRIPSPPQSGSGSGFFVSKMGHVITNAHVVKGCKKLTVGDNANKQVPAELINTDRSNDLALLKLSTLEMASADSKSLIQKLSITVVPLASKGLLRSDDVRLGEKVLVAGYPFGDTFSNTIKVTTGVVSATRGAGDNSGQFQLDAAVQPGNSGGPIYDSGGNIVGVVVAQINKKTFGSFVENMNFGIKSSTVRQFLVASGINSKKAEQTEEKSTEQLAEIAKNQALMVMCLQ